MFLLHDCRVGLSFRRLEARPTKSLKTSLGYFCGENHEYDAFSTGWIQVSVSEDKVTREGWIGDRRSLNLAECAADVGGWWDSNNLEYFGSTLARETLRKTSWYNVALSDEEDRTVEKIEGNRDSWSKMSLQ